MSRIVLVACTLAVGATLAGCSGGPRSGGRLEVVAAENVYGDIAAQLGGAHVHVTSILTDPAADPHLYTPGAKTGLAVSRANLVIQNGLGYDAFMKRLERSSPSSRRTVLTIADVLGAHGRDANPHLWYDVTDLDRVGAAIAGALVRQDPAHARDYRANLVRFDAGLAPLQRQVARIAERFGGRPVAFTEPVPGYLVEAAGLVNLAPERFTRAIEDGSEPPPSAVSAMNGLVSGHRVDVLLYNMQSVSPITSRIRTAARRAGVPVVGVTETLPKGAHVQGWQLRQERALARALAQAAAR